MLGGFVAGGAEVRSNANHDDVRHVVGVLLGILERHECMARMANHDDAPQPEHLSGALHVIEQLVQFELRVIHWAGRRDKAPVVQEHKAQVLAKIL